MKIKNIHCPICYHRTYFTGKVVYESERTQVIEWKRTDCGVILKSKYDKLGEKYNQIRRKGSLSARPAIWIRKGNYQDLLYFEVGKKLYVFRSVDVERLERDEILAIPIYQVLGQARFLALEIYITSSSSLYFPLFSQYNSMFNFILTANFTRPFLKFLLVFFCWLKENFEQTFIFWYKFREMSFQEFVVKCLAVRRSISK